MSTTFGVLKLGQKIVDANDFDELKEKIVEVAFRYNIGNGVTSIVWKNDLAEFLPDDTKVIALDNTVQGVFTIKDLKALIK